jgi:type III pantothenate kinase
LETLVLLVIDIGNSQTVIAVVDPAEGSFHHTWRTDTIPAGEAKNWQSFLSDSANDENIELVSATDVAISSVVPAATRTLVTLFDDWLNVRPMVVNSTMKLGIEVDVEQPERIGTDRLCNATAAYQFVGGAVIVVDVGTATKIEAITGDGVFIGGAIAPGIGVSLDALVGRAAQLHSVPLELPRAPIGKNTVEAMQAGLIIGHLAMIEGMIDRFRRHMQVEAQVILTGGYSSLFWKRSEIFERHDPDLTLRGILQIWRLNQ